MVAWGMQASLAPISLKVRPLSGNPSVFRMLPVQLGSKCLPVHPCVLSLAGGGCRQLRKWFTVVVPCADSFFKKQTDLLLWYVSLFCESPYLQKSIRDQRLAFTINYALSVKERMLTLPLLWLALFYVLLRHTAQTNRLHDGQAHDGMLSWAPLIDSRHCSVIVAILG